MGKCVDFFVCIVIMLDLNINIDELGVFWSIVFNLIYLEIVIFYNMERLVLFIDLCFCINWIVILKFLFVVVLW